MALSERWDRPGKKRQKNLKSEKKRQKTRKNPRNRDTVYIYIGKSHFSGYSNIGSRRWKIILGKSPPTPISSRVGITWLPRRKNYRLNFCLYWRQNYNDLGIVNRVTFVSCCTYQWAKDKTCPIKGYFRVSDKMGFFRVDHVAARQIGVNRGSALRGNARNSGFLTRPPPPPPHRHL